MIDDDIKDDALDFDFVANDEDLKIISESIEIDYDKLVNEAEVSASNTKQELQSVKSNSAAVNTKEIVIESQDDLKTDYNYIRTNLYTITERSIDALNNLVEIADQSQHPRAYEVVSLLVNTIANAQKDLMSIHKDKSKIESMTGSKSPEVVNNNLFVGNTAQLDAIIANMTKKKIDESNE